MIDDKLYIYIYMTYIQAGGLGIKGREVFINGHGSWWGVHGGNRT